MKSVNKLIVTYHSRSVGTLSMTPDNRLCAFQYEKKKEVKNLFFDKCKKRFFDKFRMTEQDDRKQCPFGQSHDYSPVWL